MTLRELIPLYYMRDLSHGSLPWQKLSLNTLALTAFPFCNPAWDVFWRLRSWLESLRTNHSHVLNMIWLRGWRTCMQCCVEISSIFFQYLRLLYCLPELLDSQQQTIKTWTEAQHIADSCKLLCLDYKLNFSHKAVRSVFKAQSIVLGQSMSLYPCCVYCWIRPWIQNFPHSIPAPFIVYQKHTQKLKNKLSIIKLRSLRKQAQCEMMKLL